MLVAFNKMDQPAAAEAWRAFEKKRKKQGLRVLAISAADGTGVPELRASLAAMLPSADELAEPAVPSGVVVHRIESVGDNFRVDLEDGVFVVRGKRIERVASQTNFDNEESAERFQRELARLGIDDELRRSGIEPGKTVRIGTSELEWEPDDWDDR